MEILWEKDVHGRCRPERGHQGRDPERSTNRLKALCLTHDSKPALNRGEITIMPPQPSEFLLHPQAEPKGFRNFKYGSLKKGKDHEKKRNGHTCGGVLSTSPLPSIDDTQVWVPPSYRWTSHTPLPTPRSCPHLWPQPPAVTNILQEAEPWGSPNELR